MNVLLDTHALLWWLTADKQLTSAAKSIIDDSDHQRFVSAVTAFEIANKFRIGKLLPAGAILDAFDDILEAGNFQRLAINIDHAKLAGQMPGEHKDPFDRLLAAQCRIDNLSLITIDPAFRQFGIDIIW